MVIRRVLLGVALLAAIAIALPNLARRGVAAAPAPEERHPVIRQAIGELEHTRDILVHDAARDFKGHRAEAVKHIDQALHELHEALEVDER
jgi:hypothetical protein